MTGWDDAIIDSLQAYGSGSPPSVPAIRSIDGYNSLTVAARKDLDYNQILKEWHLTRQLLHSFIEQIPEDKFLRPLLVPWSKKVTVTYLVEMFRDHEENHAHDIQEWLKRPEKPLGKVGD